MAFTIEETKSIETKIKKLSRELNRLEKVVRLLDKRVITLRDRTDDLAARITVLEGA